MVGHSGSFVLGVTGTESSVTETQAEPEMPPMLTVGGFSEWNVRPLYTQ